MTVLNKDDYKQKYDSIEDVRFTSDMDCYFAYRKPSVVYLNKGVNSDSGHSTLVAEVSNFQ
jgi:hypothetical protein